MIVLVSGEIIRPKETECGPLENAAWFRVFFERSADAMSLLDPQTLRYIEANEAVVRLLGAPSREALRNVSPTERFPERQPDGRLSIEKARALIKVALDEGSPRRSVRIKQPDSARSALEVMMKHEPQCLDEERVPVSSAATIGRCSERCAGPLLL
jgi:PAS domain-containing protein